MKKQKKVIKRRTPYLALLIFFSLLIGKSIPAHSQQITSDEAPQCFMTGTKGQPLTPKSLNADVEVSGWYPMPGESININGINLDNSTGEISGTPTELGISSTRIGAYDNENNLIDDAVIKIGVFDDRPHADVMLVLDKSGSMAQDVTDVPLNKYEVLERSVQSFLRTYRDWGVVDDRIGVVYFDDSRSNFIKDGGAGLHKFTDCPQPISLEGSGSIKEDMAAKSPSGFTSLGGGIFAAANEFSNDVEERNIIVFSDGMGNREPSYDMMTSKVITDHNEYPDGTGWPSGSLDLSSPPRQMKIHTLAIGDNALSSLMQDIATVGPDPGSYLNINTTDLADLDDMFNQTIVSALSDFSPAIVDKRKTMLPNIEIATRATRGGSFSEYFTVNNTASKILIKAVGDPRDMDGLEMNIQKDGVSFNDQVEYYGSHIRFFANELLVESRGASMGGDWQVSFGGRRGISFTTTCMVNDDYVDYSTSVGGKTAPGEPLNLNLEVNLAGKPASNLTQSRAFVLKPGQDLNDLFAEAEVDQEMPSDWQTEESVHPGQSKYEKLIAFNKNFIKALELQENTVNLNNNGDGSYTAQFNNTKESGTYRVIFRFRGKDPETGTFQRYHFTTTTIDFGQADKEQTVFKIDTSGKANQFMITPKNKFGHLIGPNRLNQIELLVDNEKVKLTDNLDGTYTAAVPSTGFLSSDPSVKLNIKENTYTETSLSQIPGGEGVVDENKNQLLYIIVAVIIIIIALIARNKKKKKKKNS